MDILAPEPSRATLDLLAERFAERSVQTPDGAQSYRQAGAQTEGGMAIVLLHGIGSGAGSWLHAALALAGRTRVIAWDAPGYGQSAPLAPESPGAEDYALRLHQMLDALGVERCVLAGHSLGTLMATAYAHGPGRQRVQRLILLSPTRGYGNPALAERQEAVRAERLRILETEGIAGMARTRPAKMLSSERAPEALAWVRWNMERLNLAGYRQAVQMLCNADMARYAPAAMPVEVHSGDEDTVTIPANCRAIAAMFDAPYAPIAAAGHACPIERPAAVAAIIENAYASAVH
ncbi:4,5:9,10-diseco-3-hydroxy-5,9, 17-trioxoandrosta-1(10),2-diene-4-oate hydrolase [Pigmentiphaga humi]|uniref:4,5:9,10-diseco-3-hydroxy-5,9, 17-trioxoandrosta-1(10),2-diene-4-oate hydrolase n=1 Tax=Pigmentiphaga humi TaxID=2478468 RepID=A0A3P4AXH3_9BURK|nr:alpha/beta hydrolase [Pigmentiphaga humi]VCU68472.1 4,5:9,10-diseco-3-hydroxy-5,9, 17-trioxoandrosta-1(10),2-diene-4-oate hydrolase [Pigmentiphaga humi]